MKLKQIKKVSDLKAGYHIRATIEPPGHFRVEVIDVVGKPSITEFFSLKNEKKYSEVFVKQKVVFRNGPVKTCEPSPLISLGAFNYKQIPHTSYPNYNSCSILFPFSNKAYNYLSGIKDLRVFSEAIFGISFSEEEWKRLENQLKRDLSRSDLITIDF